MTAITTVFTDGAGTPSVGYVQFRPRSLRATLAGGGLVAPSNVSYPLDETGVLACDIEPGDYNIAIVLQYARTVYGKITVPETDLSIDLRDLLSAYMPEQNAASAKFGVPGSLEWEFPYWVNTVDYILSGGGGRGGDTNVLFTGQGGWHGEWLTGSLVRGVDFKGNTVKITGTVGAGGSTAESGVGADGQPTTLTYFDVDGVEQTLSAAGGPGGGKGSVHNEDNPNAHSAGEGQEDVTYRGIQYPGGPDATYGQTGSTPGGGGGGGGILFSPATGGAGGPGVAILIGRRAS
ncbi:hypothetical protein B5566_02395 [Mycobacterium sp. MHSD3]|nr:hypothetical protein B5566_02395 [Mycobacterium sp. MHSD3]